MLIGKMMLAIAIGSTIGTRIVLFTTPDGNLNVAGVSGFESCGFESLGTGIEPRYFSSIGRTRSASNAPTSATANSLGSEYDALKCSHARSGRIFRTSDGFSGLVMYDRPYARYRIVSWNSVFGFRDRFRIACSCIRRTASSSSGTSMSLTFAVNSACMSCNPLSMSVREVSPSTRR